MGKRIPLSERQDIMQLWDWEENTREGLFPKDLSVSSRQVANWKCNLGHKYKATIFSKYNGYGCPYCTNRKVLPGFNDFGSKHRDLLSEWDYEKNNDDPFHIPEKSEKNTGGIATRGTHGNLVLQIE